MRNCSVSDHLKVGLTHRPRAVFDRVANFAKRCCTAAGFCAARPCSLQLDLPESKMKKTLNDGQEIICCTTCLSKTWQTPNLKSRTGPNFIPSPVAKYRKLTLVSVVSDTAKIRIVAVPWMKLLFNATHCTTTLIRFYCFSEFSQISVAIVKHK